MVTITMVMVMVTIIMVMVNLMIVVQRLRLSSEDLSSLKLSPSMRVSLKWVGLRKIIFCSVLIMMMMRRRQRLDEN